MPRFVYEGRTNVYWVVTIATDSTPALTEIQGGVRLSPFVAKDGVAVNVTTNKVDSATIEEIFNAQIVGSWGADVQLTMFRDDSADTAWDTMVYGSNGFLVIDRFNPSGTEPSNGDKVEVWPAQLHEPEDQNSAQDTQVRFTESFAITSQPNRNAIVTT